MIQRALLNGAYVSYKMTSDRTEEPYEINCTWWSALNSDASGEDMRFQARRFFASRSIALVLRGVPGVYVHGALGTSNDRSVVEASGHKRDINRKIVDCEKLAENLKDPDSKESFLGRYGPKFGLSRVRFRAFHPRGGQQVLMISSDVFSVLRTSPEGDQHILAFTNVTRNKVSIEVGLAELDIRENHWFDLLSEKDYRADNGTLSLSFEPYDVIWLICGEELQKSLTQVSS
jgi:sucrose phosphorylase